MLEFQPSTVRKLCWMHLASHWESRRGSRGNSTPLTYPIAQQSFKPRLDRSSWSVSHLLADNKTQHSYKEDLKIQSQQCSMHSCWKYTITKYVQRSRKMWGTVWVPYRHGGISAYFSGIHPRFHSYRHDWAEPWLLLLVFFIHFLIASYVICTVTEAEGNVAKAAKFLPNKKSGFFTS